MNVWERIGRVLFIDGHYQLARYALALAPNGNHFLRHKMSQEEVICLRQRLERPEFRQRIFELMERCAERAYRGISEMFFGVQDYCRELCREQQLQVEAVCAVLDGDRVMARNIHARQLALVYQIQR